MNITLAGTKVSMDGHTLAFQKNNLVDSMVITVDTDETWQYKLDVKYPCKDSDGKELYNVIDLTRVGNTCTAILQATMLPFNGKYTMQLRGISGNKVYHTDTFDVWVKYSIDPSKVYDPVPSEFYQIEANITSMNNHPPKPGNNGYWLVWNVAKQEYEESNVPLPEGTLPEVSDFTNGWYLTNDGERVYWAEVQGGSGEGDITAIQVNGIDQPIVDKVAKLTIGKDTVGLGNLDNVRQYSSVNQPPYPVTSVNGKSGDVTLTASDVGALPSTTKIPSKTSELTNDSGYITVAGAPVQSVDGQTGEVVTNAVKTTTQTLTNAQKAQARTNIGAGTSSFSGVYDDLIGKPPIPSKTSELDNDSGFITNAALAPYAKTADVPTKTSQLNNDSGFVDAAGASAAAPVQSVAGKTGAVTLTKADVGLGNVDNTSDANKPISTATQTALNGKLDKTAVVDVTEEALKGQAADAKSVYDALQALPTGTDPSLGLTAATVGQTVKVKAVDAEGKPTAWEPVDMPSGGGGHWETVLDTVWQQDVINPTAYDAETGIFTCAAGELDNLELNTEYAFLSQCTKEGVEYNTILKDEYLLLTKLSDTTFSINVTPPTTFIVENVKFSKSAVLAVENIDVTKIRLTLDGQFHATATKYDKPFYGAKVPYFGENVGYAQIRNAYQAYQQVTVEVESPYRVVGEILCGFHAPSNIGNYHFKHNSFCCPLVPGDGTNSGATLKTYFWNADGTKIAKLYSTLSPWAPDSVKSSNDFLKIISGTKVKLERWVE